MKITRSQIKNIISEILEDEMSLNERIGTKAGKSAEKQHSTDSGEESKSEKIDTIDVSSASGNAASNCEAEFSKWSGKKESNPEMKDILSAYWSNAGAPDYGDSKPWSAAFVSWCMQNDADFRKSASHSTYMKAAKKARDGDSKSGFVAYKPEELANGPDVGDVICKPRQGSGDGWDSIGSKNHCDVYVGGGEMIGGNLNNTSRKVNYNSNKATMVIKKLAENDLQDIILDVLMEDDNIIERIGTSAGKKLGGSSRDYSAMGRKSGDAEGASSCAWNKGAAASISSDWKEKTLVDVISGGGTSKKFDDVLPLDGGTVGIAHWAAGGIKSFLKANPDAPQPPGGARDCRKDADDSSSVSSGKNASPDSPGCFLEPGTNNKNSWVGKMKKWLSSNQDKQIAHWNKTKADEPAALAQGKGWNTSRHMAIAAGISNSLGKGGFSNLASKNGWDPEKTLAAYSVLPSSSDGRPSRHKMKRKERIDKFFPCNESSIIEQLVKEIINEEIMNDGEIIDFSKYKASKIKDESEQEWFDLLDIEELQRYKNASRAIQKDKELDSDWINTADDDFESYLQGVESGKVVDMFSDEDPISEQRDSGATAAYPGSVGIGMKVPSASTAGASANQCQIMRDEIENTTNQLHTTHPNDPSYKTLQDNLRLLQQNHDKVCGP
jgi:hypothetical protein